MSDTASTPHEHEGASRTLSPDVARPFHEVADAAPDVLWVTDPTGFCTYLNRRWFEITGQTRDEAEGFGWLGATHPGDVEEAGRVFLAANARREAFSLEYRLRHADGSYRWALDAGRPRLGKKGEFLGYVGSVVDIDDRKRAQDASLASAAAEQARAEDARVRAESRQTLLFELLLQQRTATDERAVMHAAAAALGAFLAVNRAGFFELSDADTAVFITNWSDGTVPQLDGPFPVAGLGPAALDGVRRGEPLVAADTLTDPLVAGSVFPAIGTVSAIGVPLLRDGRWHAGLYVNHGAVRPWLPDEVELVREIAELTWDAVERLRAQAGLREAKATLEQRVATATAELAGANAALGREVDEQRAARDALARSETAGREDAQRVRLALSAGAIIGTWSWDLPTDRFSVDEAFATSFGLDPALGRDGLSLAQVVETVHPDDRAGLATAIREAVARGGPYAHQYRTRRADGRYHWLEANGRVEHAPDGTPLSFPGVLIDVASRRADALVAAFADRLRGLNTPNEMALVAAETVGEALGLSRAGYARLGAGPDTVIVSDDWVAPGQRSAAGEHRFADYGPYGDRMRRGETVAVADVALEPLTPGQAEALRAFDIGAFVNIGVVDEGRVTAMLFLHQTRRHEWSDEEVALARRVVDRTELEIARRATEARLQDSEARYRTLFESIDVGFCIIAMKFDETGRAVDYLIEEANPAFERQTGAKVAGMWVSEFAPNLERHWFDTYGRVALTGEPARVENRADVFGRWFDVRALRIGDPAARRVAIFFSDITQRKDMEEALREVNASLESRVEERSAELMKAEEALRQSQKMEAVGQLTGGVAHDFNNLLTIIRSSVDFLRRPGLPDARKARYLDAVSDTVDRAAKLTGQLLAFARRQALKPEVFDVGARIRGTADMIDAVTGTRVRVETELPDEPCFVRADASQFETALVNMAVNARDAMDGEGTLTLSLVCGSALPSIRGHAGSPEAFVAVSLTDTGAGISNENLARIFEPFFTTKEVGKGTGLGLSQVFGFAKQSGGDVDVESTPGHGTTFTLYLPQVVVEAVEEDVQHDEGLAPAGRGQRVLVVEDNIEVGRFCTQILEDLGYRTIWAANAEEALDRLGDGAGFDAVFSDVVMPGMGGLALAEDLRRRMPRLPVVLASGYSHVLAQDDSHGFELLQKPYSADQLSKVLRRVTARVRRRR